MTNDNTSNDPLIVSREDPVFHGGFGEFMDNLVTDRSHEIPDVKRPVKVIIGLAATAIAATVASGVVRNITFGDVLEFLN